jgi:hypothetical protein
MEQSRLKQYGQVAIALQTCREITDPYLYARQRKCMAKDQEPVALLMQRKVQGF